jgi:hypothetical protein
MTETRKFTDDELRDGPDDFPYTTADDMAAFHAARQEQPTVADEDGE